MSDDDQLKKDDVQEEEVKKDPFLDIIRDLPKLRSAEKIMGEDEKPYVPAAPLLVRLGAGAQGCGGFLVTAASLLMIIVAIYSGFYLWGPVLFLGGGLMMMWGTRGAWKGRRLPILITIFVVAGLALLYTQWDGFVLATGPLAPIPTIGPLFSQIVSIIVLVLIAALLLSLMGLSYWKRLKTPNRRHMAFWATMLVMFVFTAVVSNALLLRERKSWMTDHRDTWLDEVQTRQMPLGANTHIALGSSFAALEEDDNIRFDVRIAELQAILDSNVSMVRVDVSGDMLLEQEEPRLLTDDDDDKDNKDNDATSEANDTTSEDSGILPVVQARIDRQQDYEQQYMEVLTAADVSLVFADMQYSEYWLIQSDNGKDLLPWEDFTRLHEDRIRHYAETYQPAYYILVTEPGTYASYSALDEPDDRLDAWIQHTEDLIEAVNDVSPETQVGIAVSIDSDFDVDYYEEALSLDGLDFVGISVYQIPEISSVDDLLSDHGNPNDFGKQLWITETWFGYCLAPQRSMELDGLWLETIVAYAAKTEISAVMVNDYGCFLQAGGTLLNPDVDLEGRTDVWRDWTSLVEDWNVAAE